MMAHSNPASRTLSGLALTLCAGLSGCGGPEIPFGFNGSRSPETTLAPADFVSPEPTPHDNAALGPQDESAPPVTTDSPSITAEPTSTITAAPVVALPNERVPVGGLIGQVNGRPIYVNEFFEPLADSLAILGRESTRSEFVATAYPLIVRRMQTLIENELLLSEAEAGLTSDERVGLLYWLEEQRQQLIMQEGGGSEKMAENSLAEQFGVATVDDRLEQLRRQGLVYRQLQARILSRIHVSWRDIQRYYDEHYDDYNPPPTIQLRLIVVPGNQAEARDAVAAALAEGTPFAEVAARHSSILASSGGLMPSRSLADGLDAAEFTAWPEVNDAVRSLKEGEHAGPVTVEGGANIWVFLESIEYGQGRTLYDVQHEIEETIREQRYTEERNAYFQELMSRGNFDDPEEMSIVLTDIALTRWGPGQ